MLFEKTFTVLTTHTATAKYDNRIKIAHGVITWVSILFPAGCHGLVNVAIYHHEKPIFPSVEGMSIIGDRIPVEWVEYYESYQPPYELKIKAWGVSCSYDHVITVRIGIMPRKAVVALALVDFVSTVFGVLNPKRIFTTGKE